MLIPQHQGPGDFLKGLTPLQSCTRRGLSGQVPSALSRCIPQSEAPPAPHGSILSPARAAWLQGLCSCTTKLSP